MNSAAGTGAAEFITTALLFVSAALSWITFVNVGFFKQDVLIHVLPWINSGDLQIAWSLRAEPIDDERSIFHTETRVATTDPHAREQFRRYWSYVAPGVELIRIAMLRPVKRDAERRVAYAERQA